MASLDLLNAVQSLLIQFANENTIDLSRDFPKVEDFKMFVVGLTIHIMVKDLGFDPDKAYDVVFGDGHFQKLADELYSKLTAA